MRRMQSSDYVTNPSVNLPPVEYATESLGIGPIPAINGGKGAGGAGSSLTVPGAGAPAEFSRPVSGFFDGIPVSLPPADSNPAHLPTGGKGQATPRDRMVRVTSKPMEATPSGSKPRSGTDSGPRPAMKRANSKSSNGSRRNSMTKAGGSRTSSNNEQPEDDDDLFGLQWSNPQKDMDEIQKRFERIISTQNTTVNPAKGYVTNLNTSPAMMRQKSRV